MLTFLGHQGAADHVQDAVGSHDVPLQHLSIPDEDLVVFGLLEHQIAVEEVHRSSFSLNGGRADHVGQNVALDDS